MTVNCRRSADGGGVLRVKDWGEREGAFRILPFDFCPLPFDFSVSAAPHSAQNFAVGLT
jgi:hypothetical protein